MIETDCPTCTYPVNNSRVTRLNAELQDCPAVPFNTIFCPNFGNIPLMKGDVTWLNGHVMNFISENVELLKPCAVRICNGSVYEATELREIVVKDGKSEELKHLNALRINDSSSSSSEVPPDQVHAVSKDRIESEPYYPLMSTRTRSGEMDQKVSADWISQDHFQRSKEQRFSGCMNGRVMYVVPFAMGPIGGRNSLYGVQITDDPILVLNLRTIFRVSSSVWDAIGISAKFTKSIHSIGEPRPVIKSLLAVNKTVASLVIHQHEENTLWAFGSSFGRSEKIGKRLSIGALGFVGSRQGWMAINGTVLAITSPSKVVVHVCYSSRSQSLMANIEHASLPGWKVETIGSPNGSVWVHWRNGRMFAIGTENDEMMAVGSKDNLANLLNGSPASYEVYSANPQNTSWTSDVGVAIDAIIFENGRADEVPIVMEANNWTEGVVLAAAAKCSLAPKPREEKDDSEGSSPSPSLDYEANPLGMRGYLTYNFGKMVEHWLHMGNLSVAGADPTPVPAIFMANLKQELEGKTIWPGGIENLRLFEFVHQRCTSPSAEGNITKYAIGKVPKELNLEGIDPSVKSNWSRLVNVDTRFWMAEVSKMNRFFELQMGTSKPKEVDQVITEFSSKL